MASYQALYRAWRPEQFEDVCGQEAVTRVDGVGAGLLGGVEDLVEDEVRLRGRLAAQRERLVGHRHEGRVSIRLRINGDRRNAGVLRGADDANGDLATVGDENLRDLLGGLLGHETLLFSWAPDGSSDRRLVRQSSGSDGCARHMLGAHVRANTVQPNTAILSQVVVSAFVGPPHPGATR